MKRLNKGNFTFGLLVKKSNMQDDNQDIGKEDLHELAGLTCVGKDEDGDFEWVGTKKAWDYYDQLVKTQEKEI